MLVRAESLFDFFKVLSPREQQRFCSMQQKLNAINDPKNTKPDIIKELELRFRQVKPIVPSAAKTARVTTKPATKNRAILKIVAG